MNLVLTYHRIVPTKDDVTGFFDTTVEEFSLQLRSAVDIWKNIRNQDLLFEDQDAMSPRAPHLVVTFDDGTEDHYKLAAPLLEQHSMRGIFYVSVALLDTPGYLTKDQCRDLVSRGHAVENHGYQHIILTGISKELVLRELEDSKRDLESLGCGKLHSFAAVGGYLDASLEEDLRATGFWSVRTLKWGYNNYSTFRWESFNVNRRTGGDKFRFMARPTWSRVKKLVYALKEGSKGTLLRKAYYSLRDGTRS